MWLSKGWMGYMYIHLDSQMNYHFYSLKNKLCLFLKLLRPLDYSINIYRAP